MNIFKSLSLGDGRISETNITSFLSYLLNSGNELDNSFIILFLSLIDSQLNDNKIEDKLGLKQATIRDKIIYFSKRFSVIAEPEFSVTKDGRRLDIDIFMRIINKNEENDFLYILIENKVKVAAKRDDQAAKQFEFFTQTETYTPGLPVYSVLITSDFDAFQSMYNNTKKTNSNSSWLRWTNQKHKDASLEATLRKLLMFEQQADIQPINPNTQYIVKSFIDYILSEFSNPYTGQRNFSFNGSDEVDQARVMLDDHIFNLRRYENKMIRAFDENEEEMDIEVLPLLRKINERYNLEVSLFHQNGTHKKNTQVFGKEVISAYNRLQK